MKSPKQPEAESFDVVITLREVIARLDKLEGKTPDADTDADQPAADTFAYRKPDADKPAAPADAYAGSAYHTPTPTPPKFETFKPEAPKRGRAT